MNIFCKKFALFLSTIMLVGMCGVVHGMEEEKSNIDHKNKTGQIHVSLESGAKGKFESHNHIEVGKDFVYVSNNRRDKNASFWTNCISALADGGYDAVKAIPAILMQQFIDVGLALGIKKLSEIRAPKNPFTEINKCTELLEAMTVAEQTKNEKGFNLALQIYCQEMSQVKKIGYDGVQSLREHINFFDQKGMTDHADWQRKNFNLLIDDKKAESFEDFLNKKKEEVVNDHNQNNATEN